MKAYLAKTELWSCRNEGHGKEVMIEVIYYKGHEFPSHILASLSVKIKTK